MFVARGPVLEEIFIPQDSPDQRWWGNQPHPALRIQNQVLINANLSAAVASRGGTPGQVPSEQWALSLHAA